MQVRHLFLLQGIFYFITGVWPLVHMSSFLAVTGGKTDLWLVNTVGALIAVSGAVFLLEVRQAVVSKGLVRLALGQAAALSFIDVYYVGKKVIAPIYLADALAEVGLIILWTIIIRKGPADWGGTK